MTIFAGALSLNQDASLPPQLCAALRRTLSRSEGEQIVEVDLPGFFLVKADLGAFGVPALLDDGAGNVSAVAGEPLMADGEADPEWHRGRDMALLHPLLAAGDWRGLQRCRGTFCGLHYRRGGHTLTLFVDKLGVRPLYLWVGERVAVFASALRILEGLEAVGKRLDVRGVTEIAAFGYALGTRTAYAGIRALGAGTALTLSGSAIRQHRYWRWDGMPAADAGPDAAALSYRAFLAALLRRQRRAPAAASFLSGGLDSRAIVGGLHAIGTQLHTVNFAPDQTQDQVFATLVAQRLGTRHTQLVTNGDNVAQGYRKSAVAAWMKREFGPPRAHIKPGLVWSGDGGSVALGHVYLTRPIVQAMRDGDTRRAGMLFNKGVPGRIIQPAVRAELTGLPILGVQEELAAIECEDPGRAFHLFLMLNDQRRHLAQHFEDIDLERIEFQLPFFDADFLATILFFNSAAYLEHRFYLDWLRLFPNGLTQVPWQAYPGHVRCELAVPEGLKYQWADYFDSGTVRQMQRNTAKRGWKVLLNRRFPKHLISRSTLSAAIWLTRLGIRDYAYLINTAYVYDKYWSICGAGIHQASAK